MKHTMSSSRKADLLTVFRAILCPLLIAFSFCAQASQVDKALKLFAAGNYDEAYPMLLKLAEDGQPSAQGALARILIDGLGTNRNEDKAYYGASRGAQKNDATSFYVVGYIAWQGLAGFNRNLDEAILWTEKAANQNNEQAICNLLEIYNEAVHRADRESRIRDWYKRGVTQGVPCAFAALGRALAFGLYGEQRNHSEATAWLEKAAARGFGRATAGRLFMFGDESIRDAIKAETYLTAAIAEGLTTPEAANAAYILAEAYLFGEGAAEENRTKGHKLLEKLAESEFNYLSYELESRLLASGIDRPMSSQRAILTAVMGMKLERRKNGDEKVMALGFQAGEHVVETDVTGFVDLPDYLDLAWYRLTHGARDERGFYERFKTSGFSRDVIEKSEKVTITDFFEQVDDYIDQRRLKIGPIEPRDLINEGWRQFIGTGGQVDEPLAQMLSEEGLRLSIQSQNKQLQHVARNNLGVILGGAANKSIRNSRLSNVHLYDGRGSFWGADNMLWLQHMGSITLSAAELSELQDRYRKQTGTEHRTQKIPIPDKEALKSYQSKAQFLKKYYVNGDTELAEEIAWTYESNAEDLRDYQDALYWRRLGKGSSERSTRLERIISGKFVSDMPNYSGALKRLFDLETNDTRGRHSAKGVIEASAAVPVIEFSNSKSGSKLELHALVIGNGDYRKNPLRNSVNDARAISRKLKQFGFNVTEANNLTRGAFRDVLMRFTERARNSDVTLFFYAGHGMQLGGVNYLLPTDINFSVPQEVVTFDGINLNDIKMRNLPGGTKLLFIDACRNNPFASITRGLEGRGLAPMNVGKGTLISFATRDGSVALDSVGGKHSPYTHGLLKYIDSKEDVEIMLRAVGDEVMRLTNNMQQPWKYGALSGDKVVISELGRVVKK